MREYYLRKNKLMDFEEFISRGILKIYTDDINIVEIGGEHFTIKEEVLVS